MKSVKELLLIALCSLDLQLSDISVRVSTSVNSFEVKLEILNTVHDENYSKLNISSQLYTPFTRLNSPKAS